MTQVRFNTNPQREQGDFTRQMARDSLTSLLTLRVSVVRDSRSRARADAIGVSLMTALSVR